MSIVRRERADGSASFQVRVSIAGRRLPAETFDTRREARRREAELIATRRRPSTAETCDDFAGRWLEDYPTVKSGPTRGRPRSERTIDSYTERLRPFLNYPVVTLRQTDEGTVMIGDSKEESTDPSGLTIGVSSTEAERAVRQFTLLANINVVRTWSAIRVMTHDGFPIYDQSETHPGAFVLCCHSGVTLCANHALCVAPLIARGALDDALVAPFSARRFHVQAAG